MCRYLSLLVVLLLTVSPVAAGVDEFAVTLRLDERLQTGGNLGKGHHVLAERPGVGRAVLRYDRRHFIVEWQWAEGVAGPAAATMLPAIPAEEPVTFAWQWDAAAGRMQQLVGGVPMRPDPTVEPWDVPPATGLDVVREWPATLTAVRAGPALREILGLDPPPAPDVTGRLGHVLYANKFDLVPEDWVIEGPLRLQVDEGRLVMDSTMPDAVRPEHGHGTIWLPPTLPETYVIDWMFESLGEDGLAMLCFDARPRPIGITDIFDPQLPPRDGTFNDYTAGQLDSMHVSYFADPPHEPSRGTINLRQNRGLILRAIAPTFITGGDGKPVRMRLIRDVNAMWLLADGAVVMHAPLDPPTGGRVGLRQMQWTHAAYDDLTITELHAAGEGASP
jgi:hypothetical protein